MCGIAGIWLARKQNDIDARRLARRMATAIRHRGPDSSGEWGDRESGIALAHRRLSIIDLSPAGAQPMEDLSGRYVIVFNGEIYNHLDLRIKLEDKGAVAHWRGHSDTETLLAAIAYWGLERALDLTCGMFAFGLWDRATRNLTLARDRLGEKPLYYGWSDGALLFASELDALLTYPGFDNEIDRSAVAAFLRFSYIPEPATIFQNIRKLQPGHFLRLTSPFDASPSRPYWSLESVALAGVRRVSRGDYEALCGEVETCLEEVVASQMLSDVPLGCFLSGGIDSSLIAALMQRSSRGATRTFSIGFENQRFNEAGHARLVAQHLGTTHTEFILTEANALSVVPELPKVYSEPFADPSQIPTLLLSRMTRQHVAVALSGDGGDEMFGGYNRYIFAPGLWRISSAVPKIGRIAGGRLIAALQSFGANDRSVLRPAADIIGLPLTTIDKLSKFGGVIARAHDSQSLYREIVSTFSDPAEVLLQPESETPGLGLSEGLDKILCLEEWMMAMDAVTYLPGDILVKVDRAAMSASLETRAPFLDRRVVELAWRLPLNAKIDGRIGKRILRDILYRHVPRDLMERPKQGFAIPLDQWLRGDLREWAESLISETQLASTGVFDPSRVRLLWRNHQSKADNAGWRIWAILMMQSWLLHHASRT